MMAVLLDGRQCTCRLEKVVVHGKYEASNSGNDGGKSM